VNLTFDTSISALVTGASRGIGRSCAEALSACGVPVAVNYHRSRAQAESLVGHIVSAGGSAVAFQANMASAEEARELVRRAEAELGPLGILINNAGITRDRLVIQMTEDDWDIIWNTDLVGPRAAALQAIAQMAPRSCGRIVNVSSVVGSFGNAGQANYAAAKSAINGLTLDLAITAAPASITVNCVIPGYIDTDATSSLSEEQKAAWMTRVPLRQLGTTQDVVSAILFLCSNEARYITGQCLAVDAGILAALNRGVA
jgi:3-oxoacyl-[acyl-carrier protein] reductase